MNILFYSDSPVFGGHESMACRYANELSKKCKVSFAYRSEKCLEKLDSSVFCFRAPTISERPFALLRSKTKKNILGCKKTIKDINPDTIILVQGNIELSIAMLWAKEKGRPKIISYIPMANRLRDTGAFLGSLRDRANQCYYRMLDGFITISDEQVNYLREYHGVISPVFILNNVIDDIELGKFNKICKNAKLKILTLGRLDENQKGLSLIPSCASAVKNAGIDFKWRIVGSGSGLGKVKKYSEKYKEIEVLDWTSDTTSQLEWADVVFSMSKYEGLPLVMLESLAAGKYFIGSNIPCFREYLPAEAVFDKPSDVPLCINRIIDSPEHLISSFVYSQQKMWRKHSYASFSINVDESLKWLSSIG